MLKVETPQILHGKDVVLSNLPDLKYSCQSAAVKAKALQKKLNVLFSGQSVTWILWCNPNGWVVQTFRKAWQASVSFTFLLCFGFCLIYAPEWGGEQHLICTGNCCFPSLLLCVPPLDVGLVSIFILNYAFTARVLRSCVWHSVNNQQHSSATVFVPAEFPTY